MVGGVGQLPGSVQRGCWSSLIGLSPNVSLLSVSSSRPAHFNLGVVYSERREFDLAMTHYQLAVARNPTYVEALCNIGVIYKNSGELRLSIEYYERALRANPNFSIAQSNLSIAMTDMGTAVKNEGRLEEGISYYKRALHHHSRYPAAWYNLGQCKQLHRNGGVCSRCQLQYPHRCELIASLRLSAPLRTASASHAGVAYAEKCRFDDSKVCYEMAVLFDPKCAEAYNNLGTNFETDAGPTRDRADDQRPMVTQKNAMCDHTCTDHGIAAHLFLLSFRRDLQRSWQP